MYIDFNLVSITSSSWLISLEAGCTAWFHVLAVLCWHSSELTLKSTSSCILCCYPLSSACTTSLQGKTGTCNGEERTRPPGGKLIPKHEPLSLLHFNNHTCLPGASKTDHEEFFTYQRHEKVVREKNEAQWRMRRRQRHSYFSISLSTSRVYEQFLLSVSGLCVIHLKICIQHYVYFKKHDFRRRGRAHQVRRWCISDGKPCLPKM